MTARKQRERETERGAEGVRERRRRKRERDPFLGRSTIAYFLKQGSRS
jgi:hypothetical protein